MISLYAINAGYRKVDIGTNWFYVLARNVKEARRRFNENRAWLDVYKIELCDEKRREEVLSNQGKYVIF